MIGAANAYPGDEEDDNDNDNSNGSSPGADTGKLTVDELEVFNLINQQRTKNGLKPLSVDPALQDVARIKARDMADNNYFSHNSPTYGTPFQMLNTFGITYKSAAENIAGNPSNSAAVTAWMNSSGHRTNILNGSFDYTGIGVVEDPRYGKTFVQLFLKK